jgi:hypothetical protein
MRFSISMTVFTLLANFAFASLPNRSFWENDLQEKITVRVERFDPFRDLEAFPAAVDYRLINFAWPLNDKNPTVHRQIGLPQIGFADNHGYADAHEGLDVARTQEHGDDRVFAPFDGFVIGYDQGAGEKLLFLSDNQIEELAKKEGVSIARVQKAYHRQFYEFELAFFDPKSGVLLTYMHVEPNQKILDARRPMEIHRGEEVGRLAVETLPERFRHVHIEGIDLVAQRRFQALTGFKSYSDNLPPKLSEMYLLDDDGNRVKQIKDGKFDVEFIVSDTDRIGGVILDLGAIEYDIIVDSGAVLKSVKRCGLADPYLSFSTNWRAVRNLLDLDYQKKFLKNQTGHSSYEMEQKEFAYVLTHLERRREDGRCYVLNDEDGFIEIKSEYKSIKVIGKVFDYSGNVTPFSYEFSR